MAYRWARHRVLDRLGNDNTGLAALSLWRVARAAADETLQGSPLTAQWLKLFSGQLSDTDTYWFRWKEYLAASTELRRAYSGLYGRFVARALLDQHLGLTRFLSLRRDGLDVPGAPRVARVLNGDLPDWLAWDNKRSRFVLAEAKGSLTSTDFHAIGGPKCVLNGKKQFGRVETTLSGKVIRPDRWVAATRWATEWRKGDPTTVLWDPPVEEAPFSDEEARKHRKAMTSAWLDAIAPRLGWSGAQDLLSESRGREALVIRAEPGKRDGKWPQEEPDLNPLLSVEERVRIESRSIKSRDEDIEIHPAPPGDTLLESDLYGNRTPLDPPQSEKHPHEGAYVAALVTPFGIQPIRTKAEFDVLRRAQDRAKDLQEPAMAIGLPLKFDLEQDLGPTWLDDAGIATPIDLSLFDLRYADAEPHDSLK